MSRSPVPAAAHRGWLARLGGNGPGRSRSSREGRTGTERLARCLTVYRAVAVGLGVAAAAVWVGPGNHAAGAVVVAASLYAAMITAARQFALAGRGAAAVMLLNVTIWPPTLVGAAVSPSALPISAMSALPAALMAVTELDRRSARRVLIGAWMVTLAVTVISRTIGVSDAEQRTPNWIEVLMLIVMVPVLMALVSGIGWQNHQQLADRAEELLSSRQRLIAAADRERQRVDAELRNGAQRRIDAAIGLLDRITAGPGSGHPGPGCAEDLARAQEELRSAIADLRRAVTRLRPAALNEHGLDPALHTAAAALAADLTAKDRPADGRTDRSADDAGAGPAVELRGLRRYSDAIEGALWQVSLDALELVVRAGADSGQPARLELRDEGDAVVLTAASGPIGSRWHERGDLAPQVQALDDRLAAVDGWAEGRIEHDGDGHAGHGHGRGTGSRVVIHALVPIRSPSADRSDQHRGGAE